MVAECSVILSAECLVAGGTGASVVGDTGDFRAAFLANFAWCHPNLLLHALHHSDRWGNVVPMSISLSLVWATPWHGGLLQFWAVLLF